MARCDITGKGARSGNNRSHARNKTKRTFKANIQSKKLHIDGSSFKAKLCTKVIKSFGKDEKGIKKLIKKLKLSI